VELRQLEAFVAVATEQHFGRAAEKLHIGQPTVSDLVRRLEREMGTTLLIRTTRRVSLTCAGAELHQRAVMILNEVAAAAAEVHRFAEGIAGAVRVGVTPPVSPVLAHHLASVIHAEAPDVDISIRRMWLHDLERVVAEHEIDVAITFGPVSAQPGVVSETICGEPLLVGLRPDHRLAGRATVTLADLAGETLGLPSKELFPAWALAQRHALDVAAVSPPAVELADTDLSAHNWPTQSEVDWILTTASIAAPDMPAAIRPVGPRQLIPYTIHWAPGRNRNPAVSHFVRSACRADVPMGWTKFSDQFSTRRDISA
jgi:DNA-binding transcriptional LysR family regulator